MDVCYEIFGYAIVILTLIGIVTFSVLRTGSWCQCYCRVLRVHPKFWRVGKGGFEKPPLLRVS